MQKQAFLDALRRQLSGLPEAEIEERLTFYSEMIDDRMEDGLSEEEAVASVDSAAAIPEPTTTDPVQPKRQLKAWEIVLLVLGSPIWLSLAISAIAVVISLYAALWSVIVSLWAVFGAMAGTSAVGLISGIGTAIGADGSAGIALVGASLVCAGLSIFVFFGCKAATKGTVVLTKKIVLGINQRLVRKEGAK